jgi:hypothetical protein
MAAVRTVKKRIADLKFICVLKELKIEKNMNAIHRD